MSVERVTLVLDELHCDGCGRPCECDDCGTLRWPPGQNSPGDFHCPTDNGWMEQDGWWCPYCWAWGDSFEPERDEDVIVGKDVAAQAEASRKAAKP